MCADGPVIDDAPALRLLILHDTKGSLRAKKAPGQIHTDNAGPIRIGQIFKGHTWHIGAGIIEQHIQPPETLLHGGEKRIHRGRVGHIGRHRQRA
jgi:hypothetical protein